MRGNIARQKGQAALDFMMSYGWAISLVVIVAAALFLLGVFDFSSFLGTTASGFSGVTVSGWQMDSAGAFSFKLANQAGQRINITSVEITSGTASTTITPAYGILENGAGSGTMATSTSLGAISPGAGYSAKVVINYVDLNSGFAASSVGTLTGKAIYVLTCVEPTSSPPAGSFTSAQAVALLTEGGSTTYYTTDGSTPTAGSPVYSTPISVPADTTFTIKAFSVREGFANSSMYSGTFTVTHTLSTPAADPAAGSFTSAQSVTLSGEAGSTIHYTTDGSTPTAGSPVYSTPITVPLDTATTIKALAVKSGYAASGIFSGTFTVTHPPYNSPQLGQVCSGASTNRGASANWDACAAICTTYSAACCSRYTNGNCYTATSAGFLPYNMSTSYSGMITCDYSYAWGTGQCQGSVSNLYNSWPPPSTSVCESYCAAGVWPVCAIEGAYCKGCTVLGGWNSGPAGPKQQSCSGSLTGPGKVCSSYTDSSSQGSQSACQTWCSGKGSGCCTYSGTTCYWGGSGSVVTTYGSSPYASDP